MYTVNAGVTDYLSNINTAVSNWMYTGWDNPIYMTPVTSTYGSTKDVYTGEYLSLEILIAQHFK